MSAHPTPAPARPRRSLFHGLGVSTAVVLLLALMIELAGLVLPALSPERLDPEVRMQKLIRVEPHPYLAYALRPGFAVEMHGIQISHNALGFRGPETTWEKPPGVFRILCLGGSSTYGQGPTRDATNWPWRLQELLAERNAAGATRVEVINAGCPGWSTFESLINLELRGVDLEPDLVLVYHALNDMRCALYGEDPRRDNTHWRTVWPTERPSALGKLVQASTTARLLRSLDPGWKVRRGSLGHYVIRDFHPTRDDYVKSAPPELGFQSLQRNLTSMVAVARAHGARVAFVTEGMRYADLDKLPSRDTQVWGMGRALEVLRSTGAALDVPVIEAADVLEGQAAAQRAEQGVDRIFTDEVHLTDEGADLLARTLDQALRQLGAIPGR